MSFGNNTFSDYKQSVRVVATTNQNISSAPASIDGVTLAAGDRVLLTGQTTGANNGIYEFNGSGSAMTRAGDSKSDRAVTEGMRVWVGEGSTYADSEWILTTNDPITVGSTALNFVQGAGADSAYVKIVGDTMTGSLNISSGNLDVQAGDVIAANAKMGEHPTNAANMAVAHEDNFGSITTLALWQTDAGVTVLNTVSAGYVRIANVTQFDWSSAGLRLQNDMNANSNNITNVGTVDGVDVSAHASRHEANGADALAWETIHGYDTTASRPAAAATNSGYLFYSTDDDELSRSNGTTWDTLDIAPAAHASTHIRAGSDEIDGDQLDVDYVPTYYTRNTSPTEVTSTQHLTAHFAGVDDELDGLRFPPFYSCYRGGAQNATTSWSDITWDNESGDQKFNETVGASIQVPETGEYMIIAQMTIANGSGDQWQGLRIRIAGSEVARATNRSNNGNAVQVTTFNSLTTGQAVSVQKIADSTRAITVGAQFTWLRIVKIGD